MVPSELAESNVSSLKVTDISDTEVIVFLIHKKLGSDHIFSANKSEKVQDEVKHLVFLVKLSRLVKLLKEQLCSYKIDAKDNMLFRYVLYQVTIEKNHLR